MSKEFPIEKILFRFFFLELGRSKTGGIVLICTGYCNKMPYTMQFINNKVLFLVVPDWEVQKSTKACIRENLFPFIPSFVFRRILGF